MAQTVQSPPQPVDRRVFVNVTGDKKLSQRLWNFLQFELDDAGLSPVTSEDAAYMIDVELTAENTVSTMSAGLLHQSVTIAGKTEEKDSCETVSSGSGESEELWNAAPDTLIQNLKEWTPNLNTIYIDAASRMDASEKFRDELQGAVRRKALRLQSASGADVQLRVDLSRAKVPVETRVVHYRVEILSRAGFVQSDRGDIILSVRTTGLPPPACGKRFDPDQLGWMVRPEELFLVAHRSAVAIAKVVNQAAVKEPKGK